MVVDFSVNIAKGQTPFHLLLGLDFFLKYLSIDG